MDIRQLRYFLAIAELGSITRAAGHLNVAQPALSLHIKNMEAHLGTRLLTRSRAGTVPTEAGLLLMHRARAILDDLARAEDEIRTLDADPTGQVRIGLPGTISGLIALPLMEQARQSYPRITLTIAEAMSGFVADWIGEGRIDLAVLYDVAQLEGLVSRPLLEEELVVLWPGDADAAPEQSLTALHDVPLVVPSGAHGLRQLIDTACQTLGFAPQIAVEIDSYSSIKQLVSAGFGASILPAHAATEEIRQGSLKISHIAEPGLWRGVHLVTSDRRPKTRAQEAIHQLMREVIGDFVTNGKWSSARVPQQG
jgi:LysR family transcriptional regulator, nitrogen assimilation regulatory protein